MGPVSLSFSGKDAKGTGPKPLVRPSSRCPARAGEQSLFHKKKTNGSGGPGTRRATVGKLFQEVVAFPGAPGESGGDPSSIRRKRMVRVAPSLPGAAVVMRFHPGAPEVPGGSPSSIRRKRMVRVAPGPPGATVGTSYQLIFGGTGWLILKIRLISSPAFRRCKVSSLAGR